MSAHLLWRQLARFRKNLSQQSHRLRDVQKDVVHLLPPVLEERIDESNSFKSSKPCVDAEAIESAMKIKLNGR